MVVLYVRMLYKIMKEVHNLWVCMEKYTNRIHKNHKAYHKYKNKDKIFKIVIN